MELPNGVRLIARGMNRDLRGNLTWLYRNEWQCGVAPMQWDVARSARGSLRGSARPGAARRTALRNRSAGLSVQTLMEMLLAVLLALMIPALLTYLPPDL